MLSKIKPENILFLDIETVPQAKTFDHLSERMQKLWSKKSEYFRKNGETPAEVYQRAGIYAEFGKIVCISVGNIHYKSGEIFLRIKSFYGENEHELLLGFCKLIRRNFNKPQHLLCAHNGKEFDFPYISRRCLINGIEIPQTLNSAGKKPWEVKHLDTMELWKFGDYKHYTSLNLLTAIFDIPTPKDDIDGSQVADVYWNEKNIERIVRYCEKDVIAIVQLFLRYNGKDLIPESAIKIIS